MNRLRVDHLALKDAPASDVQPYDLKVVLNRTMTQHEGRLFITLWDELSSPELHGPGHASVTGDTLVLDQTSRQDFFLRHRARLNRVLQEIEQTTKVHDD